MNTALDKEPHEKATLVSHFAYKKTNQVKFFSLTISEWKILSPPPLPPHPQPPTSPGEFSSMASIP